MVNFIQKEDLGPVFTNNDTLAAAGISVQSVSGAQAGVVDNASLQELGGQDKTINGVRIGRGGGGSVTNTALGSGALSSSTTSSNCVASGHNSLANNTSGFNNTAVGRSALEANETGSSNTAVGSQSLSSAIAAISSVAVGTDTLRNVTTGVNNIAVGMSALFGIQLGNDNVAVGRSALSSAVQGDNNIAIGTSAGLSASPLFVSVQSNRIVMGNNDHTNAYINVPWTVTSDERRKTAITPVPQGLDFVCKLEPIAYEFRKSALADGEDEARVLLDEGDGITRYGFSAQQVRELEGKKPVIADCEDEELLKLQETYLIPVLVNAIKELTRKVEALEQNQK